MATAAERKALERAAQSVREAATAYAVLGATVATTNEALKDLHRALARKLHPDRCPLPDAHELMSKVNVAFDTLNDAKRRKAYDRDHKTHQKTCPACGGTGHVKKQKGFKKVPVECTACGGTGEL